MADSSSQIGRTLSHYRIEEELGHGGMGVVYRALDLRLGRSVALKVLPAEAARDPDRRKRFEQEARAAASLSHPGIAAVHELGDAGELFIVYEYIAGTTLRALLQGPRLPLDNLLDVAADIADALAAAHARGIVHRDLKPENVMRTADGLTKILDFGLARFQAGALESGTRPLGSLESSTETHITTPGMVVGTVAYMSPEQLEGREVDFRSDLFSFGVMLYELVTRQHPFQGASHASTISNIMMAEPAPLVQRSPLSPPELDRIVRKCLRKRPDGRYQSTRDLAVDLRTLMRDSGEPRAATPPAAPSGTVEEDDSLLRAIAARVGVTPRRWWEMHQLFVLLLYTPVALFLALKGSVTLSATLNTALAANWHGWQGVMEAVAASSTAAIWKNLGLPFFAVLILFLVATFAIRTYSIILAMFVPGRLQADIPKLRVPLRLLDTATACQFAFVGILLLRTGEGIVLGATLAALGLLIAFAVLYVEPVMLRAAFPTAFDVSAPKAGRGVLARRAVLAGAQLVYGGVMAYWTYEHGAGLGRVTPDPRLYQQDWLIFLGFLFIALTHGALALDLWSNGAPAAERLRRWFALYLLGGVLAAPLALVIVARALESFVPAFAAFVAVVALPFYQRHLAAGLLGPEAAKRTSGIGFRLRWPRPAPEQPAAGARGAGLRRDSTQQSPSPAVLGVRARPTRDVRLYQIVVARVAVLTVFLTACWYASRDASQILDAAWARDDVTAIGGLVLVYSLWTLVLVVNGAFVIRCLLGDLRALAGFTRSFPLYWLLGQPWIVVVGAPFYMRYAPSMFSNPLDPVAIIAGLLMNPPFVVLPFYERRLARELLRESGELEQLATEGPGPPKGDGPQDTKPEGRGP